MNQATVKTMELLASMETTKIIAAELDRVIEEISNTEDSAELVACVILAMQRTGKGTIVPAPLTPKDFGVSNPDNPWCNECSMTVEKAIREGYCKTRGKKCYDLVARD